MDPARIAAAGGSGGQNGQPGTIYYNQTDIVIRQQPAGVNEYPGVTVTFSVDAYSLGGGTFTYQWRKGGQPLTDGSHIAGATTATLTVSSIGPADVGSYDVALTGGCGTGSVTSQAANLVVLNRADLDRDGDVDVDDYTLFAACLNGPGSSPAGGCTVDADFDGDTDVDLGDFAVFQAQFGEPG